MDSLENEPYEECWDHIKLKERLRKTLHYGKTPKMDRGSMPLTELAVEYFQDHAPRELGKVDMQWASSVSRKAAISPCSMMLSMLYLERLRNKDPNYLCEVSSSDLFLISMMVASKYLYDEGISEEVFNDEWADSANLDIDDLNQLEREFLSAMDWNLFVSAEDFWKNLNSIEERVAEKEYLHHGILVYSDLILLFHNPRLISLCWNIIQQFCKVALVCSVAYVAGLATLMLSPVALSLTKTQLDFTAVQVNVGQTVKPSVPASCNTEHCSSVDMVARELDAADTTKPDHLSEADEMIMVQDIYSFRTSLTEVVSSINEIKSEHRHNPLQVSRFSLPLPAYLTLALLKDTMVQAATLATGSVKQFLFGENFSTKPEVPLIENSSYAVSPHCCINDTSNRVPAWSPNCDCTGNCINKPISDTGFHDDPSKLARNIMHVQESQKLPQSPGILKYNERNVIECYGSAKSHFIGNEPMKNVAMHCEWSLQEKLSSTLGFWTNVPVVAA